MGGGTWIHTHDMVHPHFKDGSCSSTRCWGSSPLLLHHRGTGTSYAFVGNSALHWAAAKGHRRCVKWLLQQGAAVGAMNEAGAAPLHTAVEHGQPGCAQLLVLLGCGDVGAQDGYGQTVLSLARSTGVRGEQQLLLWEEARKLQQQDRCVSVVLLLLRGISVRWQ
jgi:hypothetical protein